MAASPRGDAAGSGDPLPLFAARPPPREGTVCQCGEQRGQSRSKSRSKHGLPCPPPAPGTARPGRRPRSPVEIIGQNHGQQGGADPPEQAGRVAGQHLRILLKVGERRLAAGAGQPPAEDEKSDYGQAHTAWVCRASATQTICPAKRGQHFWVPPSQQRPAGLSGPSAGANGASGARQKLRASPRPRRGRCGRTLIQ